MNEQYKNASMPQLLKARLADFATIEPAGCCYHKAHQTNSPRMFAAVFPLSSRAELLMEERE